MDDNNVVNNTSISKVWTTEDEKNKFICRYEPLIQRLNGIILKLSAVTNGSVVLDNIAQTYLDKILNLDSEFKQNGHSIFEKGSVLIDLDFYFLNKMEKAINKLNILIDVLERIVIIYTISETVNYYANKSINIFTKSFIDLKREISNFSINENFAEICVSNFSDFNNYEYYQPGDFNRHYESILAYLAEIGAESAIQDFPIIVAPVVKKREEELMKNNDFNNGIHYMF